MSALDGSDCAEKLTETALASSTRPLFESVGTLVAVSSSVLALLVSAINAYYLKEDLRRFWEQPGKRFATTFLDGWIRRAEASGIKILQQMAKTLAAHRSGLLAYDDVMISSGPMEGTNHKIKTMKRQAYGFRDWEFVKLKILAIHETKYALVG